jgi:uncharacterized protein (TIGR02118 family)
LQGTLALARRLAKALKRYSLFRFVEGEFMIHHHFFMPRRADFTQEQFSHYYRRQHIKAAGDQRIPALVRYVQSHRVAVPPSEVDYGAVAEVWYENEAALTAFTSSAQYMKFRADELNFVDVSRSLNLTTVDHVILDGARVKGMVKGMFMIKRRPGLTVPDFRQHWLDVHTPIALRELDLRRYVQCHTIDSVYNFCEPQWDGIAHLWFDDADAAQRAMAVVAQSSALAEDAAKFIGSSVGLFVAEHILIWPKE